ncbi:DNA primase [cyanobacterium endosymbiont of Rhopalodia gibberula]|uniref:DNA primase n=1 Tax=cyanobacterium endosymbiont of Rhopalodia gibberula TaxID=1763363 RepID=UPI000DC6FEF9|nr:DNA primase [cyanobacterium endosymbiont of Rhopalodia gibberula]BBA79916.1 DNA primase [cyanobacterium endosymbiont of Rhopalodia gibberula]
MDIPRLHPDTLEKVKQMVDIYDVISDYVVLKKRGKDYVGLCPFHDEKTPSFSVSIHKQLYYCFGCGEGGNAIKFLMEVGKESFSDVVFELAKRYQVPIKTLEPEQRKELQRQLSLREQLYEILALTTSFYEHALHQPQGETALNYLERERRLNKGTIQQFKLGYAPEGWETLYYYLIEQKRYPIALVEEAGLISLRKSGSGYYDRFRNRLIIPITDLQGRVIGFGSRTLGDEQPKYLNSPETTLFKKNNTLFALDKAKNTIRSLDKVVVVEGYFDAITLHTVGITNTVASLGTALSKAQLKQLLRFTDSKQIILNFDSDSAGEKATQRTITDIESLIYSGQVQLRVLNFRDAKDADEFLKSNPNSVETFHKLIDNAPLWFDWQLQQLLVNKDLKKAEHFEQIAQEMVKLLSRIENSNKQTYYIRYCAEILSQGDTLSLPLYIKNLQRQVKKPNLPSTIKNFSSSVIKKFPYIEDTSLQQAEALLLRIYCHCPEHRQGIFNLLKEKELVFSVSEYRFLWEKILEIEGEINDTSNNLISLLQEKILQASHSTNQFNHIFYLSQNHQENIHRSLLQIHCALISMEKAKLEKYRNYSYEEYKKIDPNIDSEAHQYYINEYYISLIKIKRLESSLSFSKLEIYEQY